LSQTTVQPRPRLRQYAAASAMAPHAHAEPSMSIVVEGGFTERVGSDWRDYARGHIAYVPAHLIHAQHFGQRGARQVTFEPQQDWIDYLADCRIALNEAPHSAAAVFQRLGDRLMQEIGAADDFSALACEGLMLETVAAFGRNLRTPATGAAPAWLEAARDFIHANALQKLSLAEIAAAAGRHEIHLAREFRRRYGLSVGAYLRRQRIDEATRLLRQRRLSLTEIALECGFSSHSHLCRAFRAQHGVTPSQYRADQA